MEFHLTIQFHVSKSANYGRALGLARQFTSFTEATAEDPLNRIEISAEAMRSEYEMIEPLWGLIGNWKGTELTVNGERKRAGNFAEIFRPLRCYSQSRKALIESTFCRQDKHLEGWGCHRLNAVQRDIAGPHYYNNDPWYEFGHFVTDSIWRIDKAGIKHVLQREAAAKYLFLCPKFSLEKAAGFVDRLPDEIDVSESDDWEIRFDSETGLQDDAMPVGIVPKAQPRESFQLPFGSLPEPAQSARDPAQEIAGRLAAADQTWATLRDHQRGIVRIALYGPQQDDYDTQLVKLMACIIFMELSNRDAAP